MLTLKDKQAKIVAVNPRKEMHGDQKVDAMTFYLDCDLAPHALEGIAPGMMAAFFLSAEDQRPRFPGLKATIDGEHGVALRIRGPAGEDLNLTSSTTLDGVALEPGEGTVKAHIKVNCHPSRDEMGVLCGLLRLEVVVDLGSIQMELGEGGT